MRYDKNSVQERDVFMPPYQDLVCAACGAREMLSEVDALARLRAAGLFKRAKDPEPELVAELLKTAAASWQCADCGHAGLRVEATRDDFGGEEWGESRACERCKAPIPAERIELFPDTRLCVACQQQSEKGIDDAPAEYCPRCGSIMQLRRSRGAGIARYIMVCPACG
jgi:DNA-directed RNA polymerase subunit M/transcription elongation factor TFIIS